MQVDTIMFNRRMKSGLTFFEKSATVKLLDNKTVPLSLARGWTGKQPAENQVTKKMLPTK